jgi:hypothetical protein
VKLDLTRDGRPYRTLQENASAVVPDVANRTDHGDAIPTMKNDQPEVVHAILR